MDGSDMSAEPSSTVTENRGQKRRRLRRELSQLLELHARACARIRTLVAAEPTSSHDSRNNFGSDAAVSAVHGDSAGVQEPAGEARGPRAPSMSRQSSGVGAGARGNDVEHESVGHAGAEVFTMERERRGVGAGMTDDCGGSNESSHDQAHLQPGRRKKGLPLSRDKDAAQPREFIAGEGDLAYERPEVAWEHSGERALDGKRKFQAGIPTPGPPSPKRWKPLEDIDPAVWQQCLDILSDLSQDSAAWGFMQPVSVLWPGLVDYYQLIKEPMDLGTVMSRLESREYVHPRECARDVRLTFSNAMKYNNKTSDFYQAAKRLKAKFDSKFRAVERRVANPPVRPPPPAAAPPAPPPVPSLKVEGLANRQASVNVRAVSEGGLVQAQGNEEKEHKRVHKPRRKVPPTDLDGEGERKSVRPPKPKKAAPGTNARDPEAGILVDPRLGRSKSAKAYGGPRVLTQKEMCRLANTVQDLPEDRQNIIYAMVSKKVQAQPDQQQGIAEFDMSSLDTGTMFEIFRITMNWQKSKSKILRTPKVPKEEGAGKIKVPRPLLPPPPAVEAEEEDVDIMNDSPRREGADIAEAVKPENAAEVNVAAGAADDDSDSDSSDSSDSGSSSDGSSSGSSSESDSDSDSDVEKGSD